MTGTALVPYVPWTTAIWIDPSWRPLQSPEGHARMEAAIREALARDKDAR